MKRQIFSGEPGTATREQVVPTVIRLSTADLSIPQNFSAARATLHFLEAVFSMRYNVLGV
jgi:hypothetical protein